MLKYRQANIFKKYLEQCRKKKKNMFLNFLPKHIEKIFATP